MAKTKYIFFISFLLIILICAFRVWQTTGCKNFIDYKFIPLAVKINVESQTVIDIGVNRNISRFFHNKAPAFFYEFGKSYLSTFSPRLLFETVGPVGLVLLILGTSEVLRIKHYLGIAHFLGLLILPVFVVIFSFPKFEFYILTLSRYTFSLWGITRMSKSTQSLLIFIALSYLTLWYFIFNWQMQSVCNNIFFN